MLKNKIEFLWAFLNRFIILPARGVAHSMQGVFLKNYIVAAAYAGSFRTALRYDR